MPLLLVILNITDESTGGYVWNNYLEAYPKLMK